MFRSTDKEKFLLNCDHFEHNNAAERDLMKLAETHSLHPVEVVYDGSYVQPRFWDRVLPKSLVRVTFRLLHHSEDYDKHFFVADLQHISILEPFSPITDDMCVGTYVDIDPE